VDEESFIHAEYALTMAKRKGTSHFTYDVSQEELQVEKDIIEWLSRTKELILSESIRPFFQPIYNIKTKKIEKYECLARGMINDVVIAPYKFLNAAERLDLTKNITRVMIDKSFSFFKDNEYSFSINLSGADLLDPNFINYLDMKLNRYKMDPKRVVFEVLENITTYSSGNIVLDTLKSIKELGCKLAIDDFGVENSNFSRLLEIDLDFIKIDGLFIKNILVSEKDEKVVKAIVGLAQTLGVETIAEFVENEEIFRVLEACGVNYAQGYHIGKPEDHLVLK
jgi:EAL domain-containing protein (putative c-di-GMP-specific phosphodiesterase class I)